jgi:hypothetical protein
MKTDRVLNIVLCLVVVCLAYLVLARGGKPEGGKPTEMWRTNTVEMWRTNTVEMWRTNTVEMWRTNTILRPVTNEVIKEVPARLSPLAKRAATVGYKFLNAPLLAQKSDSLYKASPIAVEVSVDGSLRNLVAADTDSVRKGIEQALRSRGISVADKSPYHLSLNITGLWTTDVPSVALFMFRLELREKVALLRQGDAVECAGSVWTTAALGTARKDSVAKDVKAFTQTQVDKFCNDYLQAKGREKEIESRLPTVPDDFLSEGK